MMRLVPRSLRGRLAHPRLGPELLNSVARASAYTHPCQPRRGRRQGAASALVGNKRTRLWATLLALGVGSLAGCGTDLRFGPPYPDRITTPEVVGLVAAVTSEDNDSGYGIVLADGTQLTKETNDRAIPGAPSQGNLIWFAAQPERWFLSASFNKDLRCYSFSADRAFSEGDSVVLAFERWPGVGIRLLKAPGFDDSRLVTRNSDGRWEFSGIAGVSFCADAEGRLSGI